MPYCDSLNTFASFRGGPIVHTDLDGRYSPAVGVGLGGWLSDLVDNLAQEIIRECCEGCWHVLNHSPKSYNALGSVCCCNGKKVICNFFKLGLYAPPTGDAGYGDDPAASGAIQECVDVHERIHRNRHTYCPAGANHVPAPFSPGVNPIEAELEAYEEEENCLYCRQNVGLEDAEGCDEYPEEGACKDDPDYPQGHCMDEIENREMEVQKMQEKYEGELRQQNG